MLLDRGRKIKRLFLMEADFDRPLPAHAVMIYGRESVRHNPYYHEKNPTARWSSLYPKHSVYQISGGHGQYFTPANLPELVHVLNRETGAL